ncbi:DUF2180 family protein [Catellatospora coxensis]|uniref:4Fe-4S Wbl-type domain-containing protein n=1 Tax=Catellatospora coxensis TaxID=310354 RepID=A0A8J3KY59_9ACTN|nr:DUF2180 family protein [Catellatospora coxensis]GIG04225.1 hypothetical protein Cco03nite_09250 [Catellatospora coxensis]
MTSTTTRARTDWWTEARCIGLDPDWWTESRGMWAQAVARCIACPVRSACFNDAVAREDVGVVRGGAWFTVSRHHWRITSLVCRRCAVRPVAFNRRTVSRLCALCSDGRRRKHLVTDGRVTGTPRLPHSGVPNR